MKDNMRITYSCKLLFARLLQPSSEITLILLRVLFVWFQNVFLGLNETHVSHIVLSSLIIKHENIIIISNAPCVVKTEALEFPGISLCLGSK